MPVASECDSLAHTAAGSICRVFLHPQPVLVARIHCRLSMNGPAPASYRDPVAQNRERAVTHRLRGISREIPQEIQQHNLEQSLLRETARATGQGSTLPTWLDGNLSSLFFWRRPARYLSPFERTSGASNDEVWDERETEHGTFPGEENSHIFPTLDSTFVQIFIIQYNIIVSVCIVFLSSILSTRVHIMSRRKKTPVDAGHSLR